MIELFHLLPPAASKFLDDLVTLVIDLEKALPEDQFYSEINSPYRAPLAKFLNRYAADAVDYFLARLSHPKYFRRQALCQFKISVDIALQSYLIPNTCIFHLHKGMLSTT
jgi:hypothetical protein